MLRVLLAGIVVLGAVASCGKDTAAPVHSSVAAGRVVEISGKVAATRNGATRALVVGAEVFRDDVVEVSDGSAVIELFHNNARWSIEGTFIARVDESVAWGLDKQNTPAKPVEHATSAAGRNAEHQAADSRVTAETAAVAPAVPAAATTVRDDNEPEKKQKPKAPRAPKVSDDALGGADDAKKDPKPKDSTRRTRGMDSVKPGSANAGADLEDRARALVDQSQAVRLCVGDAPLVTIVVTLVGGTAKLTVDGASDTVRACIEGVIKKLEFPAIDYKFTLKLVK